MPIGGDRPRSRLRWRCASRRAKARLVGDEGVGGEHRDHGVLAAALGGDHRAQPDGGGGVARHRLGDHVAGGELGDRLAHGGLLVGGGDHQRSLDADDRFGATYRSAQQRFRSAQREELLGAGAAAGWPEPGSGPSPENEGVSIQR